LAPSNLNPPATEKEPSPNYSSAAPMSRAQNLLSFGSQKDPLS